MRRLVFMLSLVLSLLTVAAQTINQQNSYRQNDRLTGKQMVFPAFSTHGTGLVWNLSDWDEIDE